MYVYIYIYSYIYIYIYIYICIYICIYILYVYILVAIHKVPHVFVGLSGLFWFSFWTTGTPTITPFSFLGLMFDSFSTFSKSMIFKSFLYFSYSHPFCTFRISLNPELLFTFGHCSLFI